MNSEQKEVAEQVEKSSGTGDGCASRSGTLSLGRYLQRARIEAGYTVQQIASEMHLEPRTIESIERDQFRDLGAPVFVKGHLKRYARLVNVDDAVLLGMYESLRDLPVAVDPVPVSMNSVPESRSLVPSWGLWAAAGAFAVISVVTMMSKLNLSNEAEATTSRMPNAGTQVKHHEVPIQSAALAALPTTSTSKTSMVLASVAPVSIANARESDEVSKPQSLLPGHVALTLKYTGDSWVEVYDANKHLVYQEMGHENVVRQVTGLAPMRVVFGSAPQVNLLVNGRAVAVPAKRVVSSVARFNVDTSGLIN
jgi:cytoskeleton protein RodZ